jgi:hypothetical protein
MPRLAFRLFIAGIVLAAPSALTSCGITGEDEFSTDVSVTLTSHQGAITILAPRESLPCPTCELQNDGWRTIRILMRRGEAFQFRAYFGGNLRDERTCVWRGEQIITVDWFNSELSCINWSPL